MSKNGKLTTKDLIGALIDLEYDLHIAKLTASSETEEEKIKNSIVTVKNQIANKTSGIDHMIVQMNKHKNLIDAEIKSYNDEIRRLRNRKAAIQRTEDYFNKELLPMIIETAGDQDGVFKTDTTRYKLYETWGALEVLDEADVPDKYKRDKIEVDKKGARKDVIEAAENGMGISGFSITKAKRVRRS